MNESKTTRSPVRRSGVGTGTTSLLMIFTVLCFATLAMLSLSTAASQQRIQQRGISNSTGLATAKGQAARAVAQLDASLLELGQQYQNDEDAYYIMAEQWATQAGWQVDAETHTLTLGTDAGEGSLLMTELLLLPPGQAQRYSLQRQEVALADGWQPEGGQVWLG